MPLLPGGAGLFVFLCFSRFFCSASLRSAALLSSLSSLSSLFARRRGRRRDRRRCAARVAPPGRKFHVLHAGGSRRSRGASPPASQGTPLRGSLSASLRSAALLSFCVVLCVFPHRAHRAHRAHYSHRAHCPRLPPRKAHGVAASRLGTPLRGFCPVAGPSGGSRRFAALHPRLIRGRRFAAFFLASLRPASSPAAGALSGQALLARVVPLVSKLYGQKKGASPSGVGDAHRGDWLAK